MADNTPIEWTDATWNPITGCSVVSPGCTNCYAMKLAGTRLKHVASRKGLTRATKAGPVWTGEVRFNEAELLKPLSWKRPRKIFVCAHGDLFHEDVPDDWIDRVFAVMALSPQHTFQVLTKRSARMRAYVTAVVSGDRYISRAAHELRRQRGEYVRDTHVDLAWDGQPPPNVWLGVSAEDQARADERIPDLLATPAAVRWLSAEPLLGPIDLYNGDPDPRLGGHEATATYIGDWWEPGDDPKGPSRHGLDWVVAGGESGPDARPMHPDWVRSLRDQCTAADVPFLFKQWGNWAADPKLGRPFLSHGGPNQIGHIGPLTSSSGRYAVAWQTHEPYLGPSGSRSTGIQLRWMSKKAAGRHLDGVLHDAYPDARP